MMRIKKLALIGLSALMIVASISGIAPGCINDPFNPAKILCA